MISATIATLPERSPSLKRVIDSLLPQVDHLHVRRDTDGKGDAGKFSCQRGDYLLFCDDDIIYPDDYVDKMIEGIQYFDNKAVISCHGKIIHNQPITSYYGGEFEKLHYINEVPHYMKVHLVGTGVMGYHRGAIEFYPTDCKEKNMADIWFSLMCEREGVARYVIPHRQNWLKNTGLVHPDKTCYQRNKQRDDLITETINSITWGNL